MLYIDICYKEGQEISISLFLFLTGVRPDVLQQTVVLSQTVQGVIGFTSGSDGTG